MTEKKTIKVDRRKLIVRDHLAADRNALANERTFLAYVRTAISLIAGGVGLIKLFESVLAVVVIGWIFCGIGVVIVAIGTYRFIVVKLTIRNLRAEFDFECSDEELREAGHSD